MRKTELLSPAGSFESGYYAIQNGADALYLGVQDFSARKSARNFTFEEVRSLKTIATENNRKIFAALNTVVEEKDIDFLSETLYKASLCGVDAFIIQDPAIIEITKRSNLDIKLHASTQMAVHNIEGASFLADQGIKRVVLSRELPLKDIEKIKRALPDLELEVFIHGALCYSFSGLCLASGMLLNRSGNQGACAQLCRSFYRWNNSSGFPFSCNDLNMEKHIQELVNAGVDSLKIEGRMKSPEYVANVTAYYRKLLDKKSADPEIKNRIKSIFARKENDSYAKNRSGNNLISSDYPGHRGLYIGKSGRILKGSFELIPSETISIKDGIMFFKNQTDEPFKVSIESLTEKTGRERRFAEKGKPVFIKTSAIPDVDSPIYLISSRNNDLRKISATSFKQWKKPVKLDISISNSEITVKTGTFSSFSHKIESSPSKNSIENIIKTIFMKSDKSLFTPSEISFKADNENIFIKPSELKAIKRCYYKFIELETNKKTENIADSLKLKKLKTEKRSLDPEIISFMNRRENLNPTNDITGNKSREIPFATKENLTDIKTLANYKNTIFIPMIPVIYSDENYFEKIEKLLKENSDKHFMIGLNNIGHMNFAKKISNLNNISLFTDFYLYVANRLSANYYEKISDKIVLGYRWIEKQTSFKSEIPFIETETTFKPPLFFSVGCFKKHNGAGCKNCLQSYTQDINGDKFKFKIVGKECKTYLFKD